MAINLKKGQRADLTKGNAGLAKLVVGLGWDVNRRPGEEFDLDASAFLIGENGKVLKDEDLVYHGHLAHESGAVAHLGDNRSGEGEGDDEQIKVDLAKVPSVYQKIVVVATIYEAEDRKQNFGQVSNAFIRIVNEADGQELMRFDLSEDFSVETAVVFGEIYRRDGEWKFNAVGNAVAGGLAALCGLYGIQV